MTPRLFVLSIALLIVSFLVYPTAIDLVNPFITNVLGEEISVIEKVFYLSFPILLAMGIIIKCTMNPEGTS